MEEWPTADNRQLIINVLQNVNVCVIYYYVIYYIMWQYQRRNRLHVIFAKIH